MKTVRHRFLSSPINHNIETLILGTFNPDFEFNKAEFFYGRNNNLWKLLPLAYGEQENLKGAFIEIKKNFMEKYKIGFTDLISEIEIKDEAILLNEVKSKVLYMDSFIDNKVTQWNKVIELIESCKFLKNVYLTRKTMNDIPNMKERILLIQQSCIMKGIGFYFLPTPARFCNEKKINEWKTIFNL